MILGMNIPPTQHAKRAGVAVRGAIFCAVLAMVIGFVVAADKPAEEKRLSPKPPANDGVTNKATTRCMDFQPGRWYLIRLRVTDAKIQAWIDADKVVDLTTTDRTISIRLEVEESKPMGIATWSTAAALRKLQLRRIEP